MNPPITRVLLYVLTTLIFSTSAHAFYDPVQGRWCSRDPIGERGGMNLHEFVRNTPTNSVDDTGLSVAVNLNGKLSTTTDGSDIDIPRVPYAENTWYDSPALELDNIDVDPRNCGEFTWSTRWKVKPPSTRGGVIVQHIITTGRVWDCGYSDVTPTDLYSNYRELWEVKANSSLTTIGVKTERHRSIPKQAWRARDDSWHEKSKGTCTRGVLVVLATATYYEGGSTPNNFEIYQNNAGVLPSTRSTPEEDTPPIGGRPSNTLQREIKVTWDCCGKGGEPVLNKTRVEYTSHGEIVP